MKNIHFILILFIFSAVFYSCSTKVDLYADYKDNTIVYGVMDVAQDTNYIKIGRAFLGSDEIAFDVNQIVLIADSFNYPGKLDARLIESKCDYGNHYAPTGREIILDTITVHNKQQGLFYAPDQKLYYTTEHFKVNDGNERYRYKLRVCRDNDTITSEIGLLGSRNFQLLSDKVYFRSKSAKTRKIVITPEDNEAIYQFDMQFNFKEFRGGHDTIKKEVHWSLGTFSVMDMNYEDGVYSVTYPENSLFKILSIAIGDDILNVERFLDSFVITISVYGKELHDYIQMNMPSNGFSQSVADYSYTNIHGGYGVFSSRYELKNTVLLSSLAQTDLLLMPWGFKYLGYTKQP